uniref:Transmembrane protein 127 n=1 Tax=Eptatretus burgeri TaxID=7764 RepID=A0A8C4NBF4_EPTBU
LFAGGEQGLPSSPVSSHRSLAAALLAAAAVTCVCAALAEPTWFHLHGGSCPRDKVGISDGLQSDLCVSTQTVLILRVLLSFSLLTLLCSLGGFLLDILGPKQPVLKVTRRSAFLHVLTVLHCATAVGFCYWTSELLYALQVQHKMHRGSQVWVHFGFSFYLLAAAGGCSVLASAANLLRHHPGPEEEQALRLLQNMEQADEADLPPPMTRGIPSTIGLPPPPAYAP